METDHPGSGLGKALDILFGIHNHQVHVQRLARFASDGFHDGESKGDVGHETAVHDIQVEEVGIAVDNFHILLQVQEIRGQNGGCYLYHL